MLDSCCPVSAHSQLLAHLSIEIISPHPPGQMKEHILCICLAWLYSFSACKFIPMQFLDAEAYADAA